MGLRLNPFFEVKDHDHDNDIQQNDIVLYLSPLLSPFLLLRHRPLRRHAILIHLPLHSGAVSKPNALM